MATLGEALQFLKPNADPSRDFVCTASSILYWSPALGAQPNQAQIDQAKIDADAAKSSAISNRDTENNALDQARTILALGDLTAVQLRAVLRAIIRRIRALNQT